MFFMFKSSVKRINIFYFSASIFFHIRYPRVVFITVDNIRRIEMAEAVVAVSRRTFTITRALFYSTKMYINIMYIKLF